MANFSNIKVGDVVRVKFKDVKDILQKDISTGKSMIANWRLSNNLLALHSGGDFLVNDINTKEKTITLENHLDEDEFEIVEGMVESLELIDVSNKFVSQWHGVNLVILDDSIYINGRELRDEGDEKHLTNFLYCVERYMTSRALEQSLNGNNP